MNVVQPGILALVPRAGRYLFCSLRSVERLREALLALRGAVDGEHVVLGLGRSATLALGAEIEGLGDFPGCSVAGIDLPATPMALWLWLRGEDRGELLHRTRGLHGFLAPAFRVEEVVDAFRFGLGLDLSGYEDGTENPRGEAAITAAIVRNGGPGLEGASFVAVQKWVHDLDGFEAMPGHDQDASIGRRRIGNEEIEDAPPSAHIKRTAQESFAPPAFILRRSMPWVDARDAGLMFVAFGRSFGAFEALLGRMTGREDGIVDALFGFSRPRTGGYFWCPPTERGTIDLRALGL